MADQLVLTPGGFRPQSMVHLIEPGHTVDQTDNRLLHLDASRNVIEDFGTLSLRPASRPLMPANVALPAAVPGAALPAFGSGWITYAYWTNNSGKPVSSFRTAWVVPPAPSTASGQTIFLFNGIQNSTMIYQPVLQWGPSAAGGGNYWAVASWYVDGQGGPAFHSTLVPVNVGATLTGVMALTGQSGSNFNYNCYFENIANTNYSITNVQELTWCIETLEAYGITKASDYPATLDTAMKAIELKVGTGEASLNWTPVDAVTDTGQHCVVVSNASPGGEVDLYYRNGVVWSTNNIGQGSGAVAWQIGDVNGDGQAEVIQLWNDNNRLGLIVYGWSSNAIRTLWSSGNMGEGPGAVAWKTGDVNGDGKAELLQMWANGSSLGMIVYGWSGNAMKVLWSSSNVGEGPGAVSWQIGDVNGDGKAELIQLWANGSSLGMIVYEWAANSMKVAWSSSNVAEGPGAVSWLIGDVNGDGKAELVQMWANGSSLGMIVYEWVANAMKVAWSSGNMGEGPGAVSWQIGDVNGDGKAEIVQLWANGSSLGMIVYGWSGSAMKVLWSTGNMGQGPGAVTWQTGDFDGNGRAEIAQLWANGSQLGMIIYGWSGSGMATLHASPTLGEGPGAVAWLTGPIQGGKVDEVVQLWNNGGNLGVILYNFG